MDRNNATAGPSTAALAVPALHQLHSTTALLSSAVQLAHDSFQDHLDDYADAHRWIDSFFDKIDGHSKGPVPHGQPRAGVFELMKTPGRKRIAAATSTNTTRLGSTTTAAAKDPLATLLFPTGPAPRSPAHADKENGLASPQPQRASPRKLLSPLGPAAAAGRRSPMRAVSPAAPKQPQQQVAAPPVVVKPVAPETAVKVLDFAAAPSPPAEQVEEDDEPADMPVHELSNVLEEDEVEDEPVVDNESAAAAIADEDKGDLSIIGEEEEQEQEPSSTDVSLVTAPSGTSSMVASAVLVPRPVVAEAPQPAPLPPVAAPLPAPIAAPAALPLSPPKQRTVSSASSVAPEADDAEDSSVPLNDAPSVLRSTSTSDALRSSLSASTSTSSVRTPGGTTSRFGTSALYSAAKLGLGSSPPPTATSSAGASSSTVLASASRTSTGGGGARQINFVGLSKKKSLGLGLGLGRNWAASMGSSAANDSQSSIQSGPASTQATSTSSAHATLPLELAQGGLTTASGATKRKSLADPDSAHKAHKTDSAAPAPTSQEQEDEEDRKRRQMLANRLQDLNNKARQSTLGGRQSNAAGPGAYPSSLYGASRPHTVPGSSSLYHPTSMAAATKPLLVSTSSSSSATLPTASSHLNLTSTASTAPIAEPVSTAAAVRRPSVMERVKSFEHNTTGQEHLNPPSPSKIPSSLYSTLSTGPHSPRAMSPQPFQSSSALSPRAMRLASPSAPSSPRALTRSATSGLPLATFGSPRLGVPVARSPPTMTTSASAGAPLNIAAVLSPPVQPAVPKPQPQPVEAPAAKTVRSPVEALRREPLAPIVRSTTPGGTPPRSPLKMAPAAPAAKPAERVVKTFVLEDDDDELDHDDASEEEEDAFSIRAINASTPASAIVAAEAAAARHREQAAAAEQAARDLEEQEAERERAAMLAKRLPSLPEVRSPVDDEGSGDESDGERSVVRTAVKEDLGHKASPSKVVLHGTASGPATVDKGKGKEASSAPASDDEDDEDEDMDEDDEDEDRTAMSMLSTATTTLNLSHQPFKPITKSAQLPKQTAPAKSSLASSATSTSTFGLTRSTGASASGIKKPVDTKVKSIQRANAASKKEKEELDRRNALREQKRAAIAQKKLDDERKLKADGLEKKRKEREETATKVKAAAAARGAKPKPVGDDEPAKKRKIEVEVKVPRPEQKKLGQPTRPIPSSSSTSASTSSLAQSQGRTAGAGMGPPALNKSTGASSMFAKPSAGPSAPSFGNSLSKSAGASSMVGQPFMSAKIRLPESSTAAPALPPRLLAPTVPKPFSSSMRPPQPQQPALPPRVVEPQEPLQELPDIDSEYSDSDDEAHERKRKALPGWAQSPAVAQALYNQQQVNPDEIFGPLPKLSIGDFFRNSASAARLRARTSSAQWDGTDSLTQTDLARYQRAMGYKSALAGSSAQRSSEHRGGDDEQRR
ncbi:uncharacterized protein RHOBADRAFT_43888 [Rhodotorula graminis WP1]|uniref:Inner centromere protein ARK-binding domain-containing protein n=1 Tax=Rhodotorula graminis (strain WP1) TaxID=578459 RepID=A0A194S467_RHOGW|nr:uncharacterized protein RHOBADRAFT_43888 [Rhodotorula graminis WP1]KPV75382.1 hypothetical protein RHOBADRAFT_43888 [Rhodotorula graminis WP1]